MDLMDKLASLAQRYEELNNLMAQPEVLEDIPLLQRYGREHSELQEVVHKYNELVDTDRQIAEAREIYESEELEMRDLAFEEMERLKAQKERLLEDIKISLLPKDIWTRKTLLSLSRLAQVVTRQPFSLENSFACTAAMHTINTGRLKFLISTKPPRVVSEM